MGSDLLARFNANWLPEPNSGCWLWTATIDPHGYGQMQDKNRRWFAHRLSYALHCGDPAGMHVCHHCDVPGCVNPAHLFLGDQRANMEDKKRKGRNVTPRGERAGRAKLTEAQAIELIGLYASGASGPTALANRFGLTLSAVQEILKGNNWRHLPRPPLSDTYVGRAGKLLRRRRRKQSLAHSCAERG